MGDAMARKAGRYLAPLALLATAGAIFLVVRAHVAAPTKSGTTTSAITGGAGGLIHSPRLPTTRKRTPKFYVVRAGNTLSGIAARTGVSMITIEHLNPGLNASALQTGQRLRLRR